MPLALKYIFKLLMFVPFFRPCYCCW